MQRPSTAKSQARFHRRSRDNTDCVYKITFCRDRPTCCASKSIFHKNTDYTEGELLTPLWVLPRTKCSERLNQTRNYWCIINDLITLYLILYARYLCSRAHSAARLSARRWLSCIQYLTVTTLHMTNFNTCNSKS